MDVKANKRTNIFFIRRHVLCLTGVGNPFDYESLTIGTAPVIRAKEVHYV